MGNRLVTVMSAIVYAKKNNRVLVIDWSDGQFDIKGRNAFDKCFTVLDVQYETIEKIQNWKSLTHTSNEFKSYPFQGLYDLYIEYQSAFFLKFPQSLFKKFHLSKFRRKWNPINTTAKNLCFGEDLNDGLKEDVVYYIDFLPFINYSTLPNYIKLKPEIEYKITTYGNSVKINDSIGIHIRSTDKKPTKSISLIIDYLKENFSGKSIFLATDSTEVEKLFSESFDKLILFPKVKPKLINEGLHQWALYSNNEDLKYTIYEESVIEMFLLSQCHTLFYQGNSTFSNISRVYHPNKLKCYDWQTL